MSYYFLFEFYNDNENGRPYGLELYLNVVKGQPQTKYSPADDGEFEVLEARLIKPSYKSLLYLNVEKHRFITDNLEEIESAFYERMEDEEYYEY